MKYFLNGIFRILFYFLLIPLLPVAMFIDVISWIGGKDYKQESIGDRLFILMDIDAVK